MRSLALLCLVAGACLLGVVTSASAASLRVGVQVFGVTPATDPAATDGQLDVARRTGAKLVRISANWSDLEPAARGRWDPAAVAALDHAIAGVRARGMRAILVLASTPCWASAAPSSARGSCTGPGANRFAVTRYPPRHPADFVGVATFTAKRYGSALAAFEVWNEPDLAQQTYWAGPDKVRRYVALAHAVYRPLKRANPGMTVLAGAFVGYQGNWLSALYRAGIKGSYDALSMHFYAQTLYGLRLNHAVQRRYHDTKPVWVTESGWTSCSPVGSRSAAGHVCVSRDAQARNISDLVTILRHRPRFVRALVDYQVADAGGDDDFGLVDASGADKPSLAAMFAALRPKPLAARRPQLRLAVSGGRVVATGTGPAADAYVLQATVNGRARFRAAFYLGPDGTYAVRMPRSLGKVMAVQVTFPWLGTSARASIGTS